MAGFQDEAKQQRQTLDAGKVRRDNATLTASGGINRLPNAPQDNPLAQVSPEVRHAGMMVQNQQVQQQRDRAAAQKAQKAQTAQMQRQSPPMQAFAQGQQQSSPAQGSSLLQNPFKPYAQEWNELGQQAAQSLGTIGRALKPAAQGIGDVYGHSLASPKGMGTALLQAVPGAGSVINGVRTVNAMMGRYADAAGEAQAQAQQSLAAMPKPPASLSEPSVQAKPAPAAPNPQGWGKTEYGANVVGRKTDNGYAFSNLAGDVQAAGNNRFKGRGGADGRVSNNGSFNVMKSEDMWRDLGGNNPLAQMPAAPARYGNAERLPDSLQTIRSGGGVNVVKSGADERNAQVQLRLQGEDLIRQGRNTRRARGGPQMVQAGTSMLNQAASAKAGRLFAEDVKAQQAAELESRERMNQGRQGLEQAQAAALEQQTQSAQQAEQARQQQMQRLAQMQQRMVDPKASPEQRQAAKQFVDMATFDPKRYTTLKGADNEYGSGGQFVLDLLTGQPIYGEAGGQGLAALRPPEEGEIQQDPKSGRMRQYYKGQWQELRQ